MYRILPLIFSSFLLAGCSIPIKGQDDTIHHLIIGLGIVSVKQPEENSGALVTKTESLGVYISNQPSISFSLGYAKSNVVSIPETTDNIILDISQKSFGPISIITNPINKGENVNALPKH